MGVFLYFSNQYNFVALNNPILGKLALNSITVNLLFTLLFSFPIMVQGQYDFNNLKSIHKLPNKLKEISGITTINDSLLGCVQDEEGIFFVYNLNTKKIENKIRFSGGGDFEGVTNNGKDVFILESDGKIFKIANFQTSYPDTSSFQSGVPAKDNEGIHYDKSRNSLVIACKGKFGKGLANQMRREIYLFNLEKNKLNPIPLFKINIDDVKNFALQKGIKLPTKIKKNRTVTILKIRMSGISTHPTTGEFYILSAFDHAVVIFNKKGEIKNFIQLNDKKFPKAEGITFLNNGDLIISNEGTKEYKATIIQIENIK